MSTLHETDVPPEVVNWIEGSGYTIVTHLLPPLPSLDSLPPELQDLPFLHKSWLVAAKDFQTTVLDCELKSNRRSETLGDAALYLYTANWLLGQHSNINSGLATRFRKELVDNRTLSRLVVAYGLDKRLKTKSGMGQECETRKIWADTYEAYIGVVWTAIAQGLLPPRTLEEYFDKLYSSGAFKHLDIAIAYWSATNGKKRKRNSCEAPS